MKGILTFSSSDSSSLLNIALQDPLLGGDGVYSARVLLGIDPDNSSGRTMLDNGNNTVSGNESKTGKIYPNPAADEATLDYILEEDQRGILEIYSVVGQKLILYDLKPHEQLKFNLTAIQTGIYFYSVKVNDETVYSDKLIIIK
jgi:hypothetical protein